MSDSIETGTGEVPGPGPGEDEDAVLVWPFDQAPQRFQDLLRDGAGVGDWVAYVPDSIAEEPTWLTCCERGFGAGEVSSHRSISGDVYIGSKRA